MPPGRATALLHLYAPRARQERRGGGDGHLPAKGYFYIPDQSLIGLTDTLNRKYGLFRRFSLPAEFRPVAVSAAVDSGRRTDAPPNEKTDVSGKSPGYAHRHRPLDGRDPRISAVQLGVVFPQTVPPVIRHDALRDAPAQPDLRHIRKNSRKRQQKTGYRTMTVSCFSFRETLPGRQITSRR